MENCLNSSVDDCRSTDPRSFAELTDAGSGNRKDTGYHSDENRPDSYKSSQNDDNDDDDVLTKPTRGDMKLKKISSIAVSVVSKRDCT